MHQSFKFASLALVLLLTAAVAFAQGVSGTITGEIHDPNGALVPNAKVTARNTGTNTETVVNTTGEGVYLFPALPTGQYVVTVEAPGFRKTATQPQDLSVSDNLRLNLTLELGQVNEVVTVNETASSLNMEDAQLGRTLTNIPSLPLLSGNNGRNPLSLVGLQPGVVTFTAGQAAVQVGPFSVNGQRTQANNYLLDGADSNDLAINVPDSVQQISPNALAEFRIVTGAMKAEFGRNGGSVVEVITKSGANAFHGGAQEIFRNTVLNATPFFQNSTSGGTATKFSNGLKRKPQFNVNDFDASFGGRIIRDKTFFFVSYLGFRRRQGVTNSATVFTDAERAAILANGVPAAKAIVNLVPTASAAGGNVLFSSPANKLDRDQGLVKIDHHFTDRNYLSGTYFIEHAVAFDPFGFSGSPIPGFGTLGTTRYQNVVLRDTHAFRSNLVNELRASFHRRASPSVVPVNNTAPSALGFAGVVSDDPSAAGPPYIVISGLSTIGNTIQGPQSRFDNTWQYGDNLSWIHGRHAFKFGVDYKAYEQNQLFDFINNGYFSFDGTGTQTGVVTRKIPGLSDPLNDFANGFVSFVDQANSNRQGYRDKFFAAYAQDDWKVTSHLTVNLGLRWEYNAPLTEIRDQIFAFRPGLKSTVFPDAPPGIVYAGDPGVSRSTYQRDLNNFAPRVGLAWSPLASGKMSIRAGYGLFYDAAVSELTLQFLGVPPYGVQTEVTTVADMSKPYSSSLDNPIPQPYPFVSVKKGGHFDYTKIAPIGMTVMDPNFRTPYSQQWNLQVQYELAKGWVSDVAYVGGNGVHLLNRRQLNYGIVTPTATTSNINSRRIYNRNNPLSAAYGGAVFGGITNQSTDANSNYNSLQAAFTKRYSHGVMMTHAYTWGHAIDNGSGLRVDSNPFNSRVDRGNSEYDVRHRYIGSVVYEFPFFREQHGIAGHVLGGWGTSSVVTLQTGLPFNITEGTDRCLCGSGSQRPDYIGGNVAFYDPRNVSTVAGRINSYFDGTGGGSASAATNPSFRRVGTAGNAASGAGRYGTMGRNVFHGPGVLNADLSLTKLTHITEQHTIELRGEAFNLFNHTQFLNPQGAISSATFGRITTTRDPRFIQFSLHYMF